MLTLSRRNLELEEAVHRGTGGIAVENRHLGFVPAFQDSNTGKVYPCVLADGRPSPFHVLDGLPEALVVARDRQGRPSRVIGTVISGFMLDNRFYTREQTAAEVSRATACARDRRVERHAMRATSSVDDA
jgi:hypothetical protein